MRIKALHPNYSKPLISADKVGAYDLFMPESGQLSANQAKLVSLGFAMEIPDGYVALVVPQTGYANKFGLEVSGGMAVFGPDYYDEWKVPLRSKTPLAWDFDASLVQFVLVPVEVDLFIEEVEDF